MEDVVEKTDDWVEFWYSACETMSLVVFQRREIQKVPSLTGIFKFGMSADTFPSAEEASEFESSFRSSFPLTRGCGCGMFVWEWDRNTCGGMEGRFGIFAGLVVDTGTWFSTSIGSLAPSCSSGIGGVVNARCCLNVSFVLDASDNFFEIEDALRAVCRRLFAFADPITLFHE